MTDYNLGGELLYPQSVVMKYSASTTEGAPSGYLQFNNSDLSLVTEVYISSFNLDGGDISDFLDKGINPADPLKIQLFSDKGTFSRFDVTGAPVDNGTYVTVPVGYVEHFGTLSNNAKVSLIHNMGGSGGAGGAGSGIRVYVTSATQLASPISGVDYFIDGQIDMGTQSIAVPAGGLTLSGYGPTLSSLSSSEPNYTMFTGAGNVTAKDVTISATGASSKVYDLAVGPGGTRHETSNVQYLSCSSLGELSGYAQILESHTARIGGSPELTLSGITGGYRCDTSVARSVTVPTALFKAGTGLSFSGRFVTNINCDLPATGALLDFASSNFVEDEALVLSGCYITRQGVVDPSDTGITPNITEADVKSFWSDSVGVKNTQDYLKATTTAETTTVISAVDTYYPLAGTWALNDAVHLDMPANGQFRLLTGAGNYIIIGDIAVEGTQNDVIDLRVTKSTDDGATWPTEVNHIRRVINAFTGSRDVAFFTLTFNAELTEGDRLRIEVENKTAGRNITAELDSYIVINRI